MVRVDHQYLEIVHAVAGFSLIFRGWTTAIYSDIYSMAKLNGHLWELFNMACSVCKEYPLSPLLYELTLEVLLQKLNVSRSIPRDLECEGFMSAYAYAVTIIVSDISESKVVGTVLKE